jgi:hypothetical protein
VDHSKNALCDASPPAGWCAGRPEPTPTPPPTFSFAGVTLRNVAINGGGNYAVLPRGSYFTLSLNYTIADPGCPGCVDQILLGFSHSVPTQCVYSGIPGAAGASGSATATFTGPSVPGVYYLAFDRAQHYSCQQAFATRAWWNGSPGGDRLIATIRVN